jgi:hypothetical protein
MEGPISAGSFRVDTARGRSAVARGIDLKRGSPTSAQAVNAVAIGLVPEPFRFYSSQGITR